MCLSGESPDATTHQSIFALKTLDVGEIFLVATWLFDVTSTTRIARATEPETMRLRLGIGLHA